MCRCEGYGFQAVYSRIEYIKKSNRQSLSLRNSASTLSINGYHETPLEIINCQDSEFRRKSVGVYSSIG